MSKWAEDELGGAQLGDRRRVARLVRVTELLSEHPAESVPDACPSWADTEATYRLWSNGRVKPEAIYEAHFRCTRQRARVEERVLVVQDGSSINLTTHRSTKDLGYLDNSHRRGLLIHPSLAITEAGLPLGLVDAQVWARPFEELGKSTAKGRQERPIFEKESYVWLLAWENAQKRLPKEVPLLGIADQEADIFELFAAPRRPGADLLIRATGDRNVKHPAKLLGKAIREQTSTGTLKVEVPRRPELPSRTAMLEVRFAPMTLLRTKHAPADLPDVPLWVVLVEERDPPQGVKPLSWVLLTTLEVSTYQDAIQMVSYYKRRWLIEQFFYALKQGCLVEELQLESAGAMERALACYSVVAWRLLLMTLDARLDPHGPADTFLAEHEWRALLAYHYPNLKPAKSPPTKREALRLMARLGGFLARKGDGEPGVKTIWKGFGHLRDISAGYRLSHGTTS